MFIIQRHALLFLLLISFATPLQVFGYQPDTIYPVSCSNLEHNPALVADALKRGKSLEDYWHGSHHFGKTLYVSDLLAPETLTIQVQVPDDVDLYGQMSGQTMPLTALVCYPTREDNTAPDYQIPHTDIVIPRMQPAGTLPVLPDKGVFPLVVLSHGMYLHPLEPTFMNLAAHGYIVVGIFHGDRRFTPLHVLDRRNMELFSLRPYGIKAVLDHLLDQTALADSIDQTRIGGVGVSLGGTTFLTLMGARFVGPRTDIERRTIIDDRITVVASIVPFLGQNHLLGNFIGWDNRGADNTPFPFLAVSADEDRMAHFSTTKEVLEYKSGCTYHVQLEREDHWLSQEGIDTAIQWTLAFLDAHLQDKDLAWEKLILDGTMPGSVDNHMIMANSIPAEFREDVFNQLEKLFPDFFYPAAQTFQNGEYFYRHYPDMDTFLLTHRNELSFLQNETIHNLGLLSYWWSKLVHNLDDRSFASLQSGQTPLEQFD